MEMTSTTNEFNFPKDNEALAGISQRFESFDFLRAIFSLAVIGYKTDLFYLPAAIIPGMFTKKLGDYVLSGIFGALAVPIFFQISLFLFYRKTSNRGLSYFLQKRLPKLISLYIFWVALASLFDFLFVGGFEKFQSILSSPKAFAEFIVSGNSSPYFFFFSLIFVTILAELFNFFLSQTRRFSVRIAISYILLSISCAFIFFLSITDFIISQIGTSLPLLETLSNIARWDYTPTNFIPYVFTSAITAQEFSEGKLHKPTKFLKRKLIILLVFAILLFSLEWTFTSREFMIQVDQAPLDHYLRLSLIFGSWFFLYLALLSKRKVPTLIKFLSDYSLGIYGFHIFFIFGWQPLGDRLQSFPALYIIGNYLIALLGAILLTAIAKRSKVLNQFV